MSTFTPSPVIGAPTKPTELRALAGLFNFAAPQLPFAQVDTVFETDVFGAYSGVETRRALRQKPYRRIRFAAEADGLAEVAELSYLLEIMASGRMLCPLFADVSEVARDVADTATVIPCDTTYRRFPIGIRVALWSSSPYSPMATAFAVGTVQSVTPTQITLTSEIGTSLAGRVRVVPLIEAEALLDTPWGFDRFGSATADLEIDEVAGLSALPARAVLGANPASSTVYDGLPLMDLTDAGVRIGDTGWSRPGALTGIGAGVYPGVKGSRAAKTYSLPCEFHTRQSAYEWLELCESRGGRAYPFWLLDPEQKFGVTSITATELTVPASRLFEKYANTLVGIRDRDGGIQVRSVTASRVEFVDTLTFDAPLSSVPDPDTTFVGFVRKCRLDADVVSESWTTDQRMDATFNAVELPDEATSNEVAPVSVTTPLVDSFDPNNCGVTFVAPTSANQIQVDYTVWFCQYENTDCSGALQSKFASSGGGTAVFNSESATNISWQTFAGSYGTASDTSPVSCSPPLTPVESGGEWMTVNYLKSNGYWSINFPLQGAGMQQETNADGLIASVEVLSTTRIRVTKQGCAGDIGRTVFEQMEITVL